MVVVFEKFLTLLSITRLIQRRYLHFFKNLSLTKLLELISKIEYDNEVVESSGLKLPTGIFFSQFFIEALVANFNEHKMYLPH